MKKIVHINLICISLLLVLSACAKKAEDYSSLVESYKKINCKTLNSNKITLKERKQAIKEKIKLEEAFKDALRHLKQEGKETLTKQWLKVIYDATQGKCH